MTRQLLLFICVMVFMTGCSSTKAREELTVEEENRFVLDKSACDKKADESARGFGRRGFGRESITWKLKHQESYNYCMTNKGWDRDLFELY